MLGIRASPKEESGTLVGEAALTARAGGPGAAAAHHCSTSGHTSTGGGLGDKRTYAEAAATPALDGATHVYVQCGV